METLGHQIYVFLVVKYIVSMSPITLSMSVLESWQE